MPPIWRIEPVNGILLKSVDLHLPLFTRPKRGHHHIELLYLTLKLNGILDDSAISTNVRNVVFKWHRLRRSQSFRSA